MESNSSKVQSHTNEATLEKPLSQEDALHETVRMIVSGYLKNNLDKHANPLSKHFTEGLKKSLDSGMKIKNPTSRDAKIALFLNYVNRNERLAEMSDQEFNRQDLRTSPIRSLMHEIAEDFAIDISDAKKVDSLAEAVHQSEVAVLIKRGQGGDVEAQGMASWEDLDDETKARYRANVKQKRDEQVRSLERWIKYVASDGADYPSWYKYFIITSLRSMGVEQFELGTYTYGGRDKKTLFRFPTLNQAVLSKVYDRMLAVYTEENRRKPTPSKYAIQDAARSDINEAEQLFLEKYAKEANFAQLYAYELSKYKERTIESKRSQEGVWVKYHQQEEGSQDLKKEAARLSASLEDKGTMWCTEGTNFSESQLAGGDFYVYYTREDVDKDSYNTPLDDMTEDERRAVCTMPRIAIKMVGNKIGELRGIVGGNEQDLELEMLDIARAKYRGDSEKGEAPLGGYEEYEKKMSDMKKLLTLIDKEEKGEVFTRDDLRFLYEVDGKIEGFGHNKDPRVQELRIKRNRVEDLSTICNCSFEHIAMEFTSINEHTQVYCEDTPNKVTLINFREEKNKDKLPRLLELAQTIKATGSPARPDMSFEGGIVSVDVTPEKVQDIPTALQSYKDADKASPSWVWSEWKNAKETPIASPNFEAVILSYNSDPKTRQSSDKIVHDMDTLGLRPATLEEMIALGIAKPEHNKRSGVYLVGLTSYSLVGDSRVPYLIWFGVWRNLDRDRWGNEWDDWDRFVCVRK